MDQMETPLTLRLPKPEELVARQHVSMLQPKTSWTAAAPAMLVNLSHDLPMPDFAANQLLKVHSTYSGTYTNQYVFGFHHLHALIGRNGEFNCQEIENYRGRLNHHLNNLPPRQYIIPDISSDGRSYAVDFTRLRRDPPIELNHYTFFGSPIEPENWGMWLLNGLFSAFCYVASGQPGRFLCYAAHPWQKDLLRMAGVWPGRIVEQKPWKTYFCHRVTLLQYSRVDLIPDLHTKAIFANIIAQCADIDMPVAEKIFVSRLSVTKKLGGDYRALRNEAELAEALASAGYMVVEPELLPFKQQVRLFNAARIVVGLGGAAMFNTVFCQPGTKVVSIESTGVFALNHARLFGALGHHYGFIFGQQNSADGRFPHNSWTIDVPRSVKAIGEFE